MRKSGKIAFFVLALGMTAGWAWAQPVYHPDPATLVQGLNPLSFRFLDFDTDRDGIADYRIVGDFNRNGVLEWDDIQMALDGFCDPNGDGVQDVRDGKRKDLDGSGIKQPFCGTLHIPPGLWVSRIWLDSNVNNRRDDQVYLSNYQGLWIRGSGIGKTVLRSQYSRQEFCRKHYQPGCGGVCAEGTRGHLTISDFTFEGLPARSWMDKMDCDGDGIPGGDPRETDYRIRTHQSAVVVNGEAGQGARNVKLHNVEVTRADYNGFVLSDIQNLHLSNLSVLSAGACGFLLSGLQFSLGQNLRAENCDNGLGAGFCVYSWQDEAGKPPSRKTHHLIIDGLLSLHNHNGISLTALGAGGISDVLIRNFEIRESRDRTGATAPFTQWGVRLMERCLWDGDGGGRLDDPCYVTNLTFESGRIIGCPGYSLSLQVSSGGPDRNFTIRGVHFEGNGHSIAAADSRDVDLWGIPGVVFEGNTLVGGDYNQDGRPDVSWLLLAGGNNQTIRNNKLRGVVRPGGRMIHIGSAANNVMVHTNTIESSQGTEVTGIYTWPSARNVSIAGNLITLSGDSSWGICAHGQGGEVIGNFINAEKPLRMTGQGIVTHSNMAVE